MHCIGIWSETEICVLEPRHLFYPRDVRTFWSGSYIVFLVSCIRKRFLINDSRTFTLRSNIRNALENLAFKKIPQSQIFDDTFLCHNYKCKYVHDLLEKMPCFLIENSFQHCHLKTISIISKFHTFFYNEPTTTFYVPLCHLCNRRYLEWEWAIKMHLIFFVHYILTQ